MSCLALSAHAVLEPCSPAALDLLAAANDRILECPQIEIMTEHLLHGGVYVRTIRLDPGVVMMGSLIRRSTTLIIHGDCEVTNGSERIELSGYNVFAGSPGRKQLFLTRSWVEMTMICATDAKTVEEAENEIFAEAEQLMSRKNGSRNLVAEGRN